MFYSKTLTQHGEPDEQTLRMPVESGASSIQHFEEINETNYQRKSKVSPLTFMKLALPHHTHEDIRISGVDCPSNLLILLIGRSAGFRDVQVEDQSHVEHRGRLRRVARNSEQEWRVTTPYYIRM